MEAAEAEQTSAFHLSSFLHSSASPALFHRFASQPSASSAALPRFLASVSALTALLTAQSQRLRSAPPPLVDRLSFTAQSLSALAAQHTSVGGALQQCRTRLREAVEDDRATASGEERFLFVHRLLQRMRRQLRLASSDELEASDKATLLLPSTGVPGADTDGETDTVVHLASAGVVSCFVIEVRLRRRERGAETRESEFELRRKEAAAAGAALSPRPLHDCVVSVKADFLQGDAELHEPQIDCQLHALLAQCRFAALQSKLGHALSMEALADRHASTPLYSRKADALVAFSEYRDTSKLPCVVTSAVDGPQLAFQHIHTADHFDDEEQRLALPQLFLSTPSTRLRFASHPGHAFTHSLTYIGLEEAAAPLQPPALPPTAALSISSSSPLSSAPPSFSYLLSLSPSVVVPSSTLRAIALLAAGDSSHRGQLAASQQLLRSSPQQPPALAYHDYIAHTSPTAASRLSVRVSATSSSTQLFRLANDATLIEEATVLSYIPVTSLRALPGLVHTLRQWIAFNQLYASCFTQPRRPAAKQATEEAGGAVSAVVDVTAFPPHTLRLRISQPSDAARFISVDIRLTAGEPHEACTKLSVQQQQQHTAIAPSPSPTPSAAACFDCHAWSVQLDRSFDSPAPCSDSFALQVLCLTHSVPALVHAVVSRARQQDLQNSSSSSSSTNGHSRPASTG